MLDRSALVLPTPKTRPGQFDAGFGDAGKAWIRFGQDISCFTTGVATDRAGRILLAARVDTPQGSRFGLARLTHEGSVDKSFAAQGYVVGSFEDGFEATAGKVTELPDGHILLSGLHYENADRTLPALALFDPFGRPVQGFGDAGRQVVRLCGNLSQGMRDPWLLPGVPGVEACDVRVQADGKILLLANHYYQQSDHVGVLIRLLPEGSLDNSFNGRGFVMVRRLLQNTWLGCMALQADGNIVMGGAIGLPQHGLIARYDPSGRLDDSFGEDGFVSFSQQGRSVMISQIVQQPNGDLQAFGSSRDPMHCLSLKIRKDGQQASGTHEITCRLLEFGRNASQWTAAQIQPDGNVVTAGATIGGIEADFILARHLPDGNFDSHFGPGLGWVRTRLGYSLDSATSVATQADGKILVGGYSLHGSSRAVVARFWP